MIDFKLSPLKKSLYNLMKLSKADLDRRCKEAEIGISPLQYGVLALTESDPITLKEIATQFNFKAPSLIPSIDALEKAGLLKRKTDQSDRRKNLLLITNKGRQLLKKFPIDDKNDRLNEAFKKLGKDKQKHLLKLLQELTTNFTQ